MSNARFSILQAIAVKDKRISDSQFRTLAALGMYADPNGWCYPSLGTLGKDLSKSKQAVGRDTIALRKLGYLEVQARFDDKGSRRSSLYRLRYDLPPVNTDNGVPSTSEVDTPSTPRVDVNAPDNDQYKGTAFRRGEQEPPDKVAEYLKMASFPGAVKSTRIDNLLSAWAVAFNVLTTAKDWKNFAKVAIDLQDREGWDPQIFIEWVKKQEGYPTYWSRKRMEENYPKAFVEVKSTTSEKIYRPDNDEDKYVPAPERK